MSFHTILTGDSGAASWKFRTLESGLGPSGRGLCEPLQQARMWSNHELDHDAGWEQA
jgi:hypothetical protein